MTYPGRFTMGFFTVASIVATGAGAWWLVTRKPVPRVIPKQSSVAQVDKIVKEDELSTITLSREAEGRIGIVVAPIERKVVRRVRGYGGEVVVPAGRTILVAAPLTGLLKSLATGEVKAGQPVEAGQAIWELTPLLTADGRATLSASLADTGGQVNNAKTQLQLATIGLDRARRVLREGAGSQRQVDEADAAYHLATKTLEAAVARQEILEKVVGDVVAGTAAPIVIESPQNGVIRSISALPGQTVPGGAPLFEVIDVSTVWIRVPLPVGDLESIDNSLPAEVSKLSGLPAVRYEIANPVAAPPSANPISATVDVFYEMPNTDGKFIPGQRVGVSIPLTDGGSSLTAPWSAVVLDIDGGTWIYERVGGSRYTRRRVVVRYSVGTDAVLASGPAIGAEIVTVGAQELFGAETGFVK